MNDIVLQAILRQHLMDAPPLSVCKLVHFHLIHLAADLAFLQIFIQLFGRRFRPDDFSFKSLVECCFVQGKWFFALMRKRIAFVAWLKIVVHKL